jgi:hypothetical protein
MATNITYDEGYAALGKRVGDPHESTSTTKVKDRSVMPIFDPDYCEHRCPICTRARKGNRIAKILQCIETMVTFGSCPWGRARQRRYGVRPDEPLPNWRKTKRI